MNCFNGFTIIKNTRPKPPERGHPLPIPEDASHTLDIGSIIECKKCHQQWSFQYHNGGASVGGYFYWAPIDRRPATTTKNPTAFLKRGGKPWRHNDRKSNH